MSVRTVGERDSLFDEKRLAAVLRTGLIDSPPEPAFDDLTRMAATVLDVPLAFATIVDDAHSYWKSCFGVGVGGPSRNTVEESFCQYVVRSNRELVVTDAATDHRTMLNPSVASMGVRAWLGFPIHAPDGEVLGSFCVVDVEPRAWTERDVSVMRTCASAASREIHLRDLARRETEARARAEEYARALQATLLPPAMPDVPGLDVGASYTSAGIGTDLVGDFYDLFATGEGGWNLLVGDICGKGLQAAQLAAFVLPTVGALSMDAQGPARTLARLNEILLERSPVPGRFLTCVLAAFLVRDGSCYVRLARAGHPPPILRRADGSTEKIEPPGQLVGVLPSMHVDEGFFELRPGDLLTVYTDGVDEARESSSKAVFGYAALEELLRDADPSRGSAALAREIETAAVRFSGGVATDDIAVVVVRVPERPAA